MQKLCDAPTALTQAIIDRNTYQFLLCVRARARMQLQTRCLRIVWHFSVVDVAHHLCSQAQTVIVCDVARVDGDDDDDSVQWRKITRNCEIKSCIRSPSIVSRTFTWRCARRCTCTDSSSSLTTSIDAINDLGRIGCLADYLAWAGLCYQIGWLRFSFKNWLTSFLIFRRCLQDFYWITRRLCSAHVYYEKFNAIFFWLFLFFIKILYAQRQQIGIMSCSAVLWLLCVLLVEWHRLPDYAALLWVNVCDSRIEFIYKQRRFVHSRNAIQAVGSERASSALVRARAPACVFVCSSASGLPLAPIRGAAWHCWCWLTLLRFTANSQMTANEFLAVLCNFGKFSVTEFIWKYTKKIKTHFQ